ncbi:diamine N-acetyltransferase [Paenibacillus turicensis]|uniref:Diamine N-acetyltransferase n=1 Tax=Paenibacillus turicensis TaxID=160487 RepID=A0ABS4FYT0_9BACL|nr:GNAT family N-acetyltransferase [Paenibacillus turicensis]MBP1907690.1 diamine N-acetyltransferase [Paenibacillus turicensis]
MINLKEITKDNVVKASFLTTNTNGEVTLNEQFVASNVISIAQSKYMPAMETKAIYEDDEMVGFVMYGIDEGELWIMRYMIDYRYQGKGFGKLALGLIIDEVWKSYTEQQIKISIEPENKKAKKLYERLGFVDTNTFEDDELVMVLNRE